MLLIFYVALLLHLELPALTYQHVSRSARSRPEFVARHRHQYFKHGASRRSHTWQTDDTTGAGVFIEARSTSFIPLSEVASSSTTSAVKCPSDNGTLFASQKVQYDLLCDIDLLGENIYPCKKADSFEACLQTCGAYNDQPGIQDVSIGMVFTLDRLGPGYTDSCYLKHSLVTPVSVSFAPVAAIPHDANAGDNGSALTISKTGLLPSLCTEILTNIIRPRRIDN